MLNTSHSVSVIAFREKYKIPVTVPRVMLEMRRGLRRKTTGKCDHECVVKLASVRKPDWSATVCWIVMEGEHRAMRQKSAESIQRPGRKPELLEDRVKGGGCEPRVETHWGVLGVTLRILILPSGGGAHL